ncbi:MAG: hypothetical protein H6667_11070 [Ardenticatenaceae bacterium]|nr:hypothetical protein [Ardenticatenaceae bacterium]MCB9444355.1 hypothetical protein [Ardenticatenaceae bacterium]
METVLTAFIVITILLFVSLTLFQGFLEAQDDVQVSWREMEDRLEQQARTTLTPINIESKSSGSVIELTLRNDGSTKLADFSDWDVIVQHYSASLSYYVNWIPYVDGEPSGSEWTVVGIYTDTAVSEPEVFEPDILNPGEEILLRIRVLPPVGPTTNNLATVTTDNGFVIPMAFSR